MANGTLDVMARASKTRMTPRPARQSDMLMFGKEGAFIGVYPKGTQLVGATFDFIAGPTKPITGVVRLKGSGKPVEGAIIHVAADLGDGIPTPPLGPTPRAAFALTAFRRGRSTSFASTQGRESTNFSPKR